jgi:arginyl-tRNA synthetase
MKEARRQVASALQDASGQDISPDDIKPSKIADLCSPLAFSLAKTQKRDPKAIAAELAAKVRTGGIISEVSSDGGYVNFSLNAGELSRMALKDEVEIARKPQRVVLEHTSVNPTGPVHVGRIRNSVIGDCLRRILSYSGYDVETHYYVNDIGKQVAIIAAGLAEHIEPDAELMQKFKAYSQRDDYQVFFTYVRANRLFEEDLKFQGRVQAMIKAAESGDEKSLAAITSAARRCLGGQMQTFKRLGMKFDVFDFESEGLTDGSVEKVIQRIRQDGHYRKSEVGEGLDLSDLGLGKRAGLSVMVRADGTSVYITRDLAYHIKKLRLGKRVINVLGEDHKLQFQELRTILKTIFGVGDSLEVVHFSFVSFEGMKFSTRKGEIAAVDELLDEAVAKAQAEVQKRNIGDERTADMIGIGAVKFHIVKSTPNKQITFRWEDALNFEGESAPYIQYAHARSCRLLEKSAADLTAITDIDFEVTDDEEKRLAMRLLEFGDAVDASSLQLRPDLIAAYLLELTAAYGRFYMKCPVLDAQAGVRNRRLLLVAKTRDTIRAGLGLLGIDAPERM